jgi:hypothetical protein
MSRTKVPDEGKKILRQKLDQIEDGPDHRRRVEALNETCPHSIKHIETRPDGDRSDCMDYALEIPIGLVKLAATFKIHRSFANSGLPGFLETIPASDASDGHVVLYFKDDETKHVGLMRRDRVISKWGDKNPVYEHAIAEVPASYGDEYEIFRRPSILYTTNKFIEFVRHHPRYVDIRESFEERVAELKF